MDNLVVSQGLPEGQWLHAMHLCFWQRTLAADRIDVATLLQKEHSSLGHVTQMSIIRGELPCGWEEGCRAHVSAN